MASVNKVILIGNITRDPELRYTPKGQPVVDLGLAMNRKYALESGEKREEVTFVDVTFWGKQAEALGHYMKKGRQIYVEGRLQLDTWDDKESGQKRSKLKISGESFTFLSDGKGKSGEEDASAQGPREGFGHYQTPPARQPRPAAAPPAPEEEDDIPF